MPARGIVTVEVSPFQAKMILWWLETIDRDQQTLSVPGDNGRSTRVGILADALWQHRDQHDVAALASQFRKVAQRKRANGWFKRISVQLTREDAAWFAEKVKPRGMFGSRLPRHLPEDVRAFCYVCWQKVTKKAGRDLLQFERLEAALQRAHLDDRHRKRLRRRQREEMDRAQRSAQFSGILGQALLDAEKST